MKKKLTYTYIKSKFEEVGYILLSSEYINNIKLNYKCSNGHEHSIRWDHFNSGVRCPTCDGQTKPSIDFVKETFAKEGYKLLSKHYINNSTKLNYMCNEGHQHEISWQKFKAGRRCPSCWSKKRSNATSPNWKGGVKANNLPLYDTYAHQLEKYQTVYKVEQDSLNILGVECAYCRKIFVPKTTSVVSVLNDINYSGGSYLYCSNVCKKACPIYKQILWPKGFKSLKNIRANQTAWAELVKERDSYTCQKCGTKEETMYAHHIDPVINNPIESMDIDNGITLCKTCHKQIHSQIGCTLVELKC